MTWMSLAGPGPAEAASVREISRRSPSTCAHRPVRTRTRPRIRVIYLPRRTHLPTQHGVLDRSKSKSWLVHPPFIVQYACVLHDLI